MRLPRLPRYCLHAGAYAYAVAMPVLMLMPLMRQLLLARIAMLLFYALLPCARVAMLRVEYIYAIKMLLIRATLRRYCCRSARKGATRAMQEKMLITFMKHTPARYDAAAAFAKRDKML